MSVVIQKRQSLAIIFDASRIDAPAAKYFRDDYWRRRDAIDGSAPGRGNAWFINTAFGRLVLRQYIRGGMAARFSREHYLYTSVEHSRPFREFQVLSRLNASGLMVPRPLAALCEHRGFLSTGALLTEQIPATRPLADCLTDLDQRLWGAIGHCLKRVHMHGVWHADLNARNILLDTQGNVFLVDFDRARFRPGRAVDGSGNLRRLRRSLAKVWPVDDKAALEGGWGDLMEAYRA